MSIDHLGFTVADYEKSKTFYANALASLGINVVMEAAGWIALGRRGHGELWLGTSGSKPGPIHVAFTADNRDQVRAFYAAAINAGGKDNGAPGIRAHYHPSYYAAFVLDPDGHNIEAVCHRPEQA
jgi:catechol 2,3-dioxygenase-like lactoylglutathione lyase family enzyme